MNIIVYTKTGCGWSNKVMAYLKAEHIPYEERNMTENPQYQKEAEEKSGQSKSPTVDIDGTVFADTDTEQVRAAITKLRYTAV